MLRLGLAEAPDSGTGGRCVGRRRRPLPDIVRGEWGKDVDSRAVRSPMGFQCLPGAVVLW